MEGGGRTDIKMPTVIPIGGEGAEESIYRTAPQ